MRLLARFFFSFLLVASCYWLVANQVHAQTANSYLTPNTNADVPANLHTFTQSLVLEVLSAFTCQIIGQDPLTKTHQCLGLDTATGKIGYVDTKGGTIGFFGNMIADLYTPPVNTSAYLHYVANNFGLVKHTYAATSTNGIGFDKLTPIQGLWTTFRNISYLVFVIVFIAIGFAIMLRVKIDPRTVMTIENQIPKIIIGLILVTFSYAIAGFLIDMMYVTTYLTINVVSSAQGVTTDTQSSIHTAEKNDLSGGNPLGFMNDILAKKNDQLGGFGNIVFGVGGSVRDIVQNLFYQVDTSSGNNNNNPNPLDQNNGGSVISSAVTGGAIVGLACVGFAAFFTAGAGLPLCLIPTAAGAGFGAAISIAGHDLPTIVADVVGNVVGDIAGILTLLVVAIAILVGMFRVWFTLLLAYVNILLEIVLAPFFIMVGLFPGSKVGFGSWFKSMVGNLLAFPVTVAMFILAKVFMDNFAVNGSNIFVPPLIGNPTLVNGQQSPVAYLIALGMILLTPNAVQLTRGLVGAGENKALAGVFQGIGIGGKATGGIFKRTTGAIFGQEISYTQDGVPKPINNPVEKLWRGFVQRG